MIWVLLLLLAWGFTGLACTLLCLAAQRAASCERAGEAAADGRGLTLYEAAFLSGGPVRVADLTMVRMARQRRLLLAHTGWATVVDPRGRDELERYVIGAIGPQGQSRIAPVRAAAAGAEAVLRLGDRLAGAGLAVRAGSASDVAAGVRLVRAAALAVPALAVTALLLPSGTQQLPRLTTALWFGLPFALAVGCLAIARFELRPYNRWASPAGQRLLGELAGEAGREGEGGLLTRLAVRGVRALGEPELRAAFRHRDQPWRE